MTGLVDGDIVCYRCAAVSENEPQDIAILRVDQMMREMLANEENHITFLSGGNNFRYKIYPEYKANRKDKPKPIHLGVCRDFLISEYKAIVTDGYEADDALGMNQKENTTIYSIDKDLLMIPGCHFNFITKEFIEISEVEGLRHFYKQMLIGDTADNIKGVDGIGKVKASRIIDELEDEEEMFTKVISLYDDIDRFAINADCLWIWRNDQETYTKRMDGRKNQGLHSINPTSGVETMASKV